MGRDSCLSCVLRAAQDKLRRRMVGGRVLYAVVSGLCGCNVLSNDLTDNRHQLSGNLYHGSPFLFEGSLIFSDRFLFRLCFVVGKNSPYSFFIPPWWKLALFHFCLLRLRRRYAVRTFPRNSYAVITKTLPGSGSGTYMIRRYRPASVCPMATRAPSYPWRSSPGLANASSTSDSVTLSREENGR